MAWKYFPKAAGATLQGHDSLARIRYIENLFQKTTNHVKYKVKYEWKNNTASRYSAGDSVFFDEDKVNRLTASNLFRASDLFNGVIPMVHQSWFDNRCLVPNSHKDPTKWKNYEMHGYRSLNWSVNLSSGTSSWTNQGNHGKIALATRGWRELGAMPFPGYRNGCFLDFLLI